MVGEIIAKREFSPLYIYLDIGFLLILAGLLIYKKKYLTVIIGLIMGVTYMVVVCGISYLCVWHLCVVFIITLLSVSI